MSLKKISVNLLILFAFSLTIINVYLYSDTFKKYLEFQLDVGMYLSMAMHFAEHLSIDSSIWFYNNYIPIGLAWIAGLRSFSSFYFLSFYILFFSHLFVFYNLTLKKTSIDFLFVILLSYISAYFSYYVLIDHYDISFCAGSIALVIWTNEKHPTFVKATFSGFFISLAILFNVIIGFSFLSFVIFCVILSRNFGKREIILFSSIVFSIIAFYFLIDYKIEPSNDSGRWQTFYTWRLPEWINLHLKAISFAVPVWCGYAFLCWKHPKWAKAVGLLYLFLSLCYITIIYILDKKMGVRCEPVTGFICSTYGWTFDGPKLIYFNSFIIFLMAAISTYAHGSRIDIREAILVVSLYVCSGMPLLLSASIVQTGYIYFSGVFFSVMVFYIVRLYPGLKILVIVFLFLGICTSNINRYISNTHREESYSGVVMDRGGVAGYRIPTDRYEIYKEIAQLYDKEGCREKDLYITDYFLEMYYYLDHAPMKNLSVIRGLYKYDEDKILGTLRAKPRGQICVIGTIYSETKDYRDHYKRDPRQSLIDFLEESNLKKFKINRTIPGFGEFVFYVI